MPKKDELPTTTGGGGGVIAVTPQDKKDWAKVERVLAALRGGCNTIQAACKEADVGRVTYYRAIKSPFVQQQLATAMEAANAAVVGMLSENMVRVTANMIDIAATRKSETAVSAARWVMAAAKDLRERIGDSDEEVERTAKLFLDEFAKGKKGKARFRRKIAKGAAEVEMELEN